MPRKPTGYGGLKKGGRMQKDVDALLKKKKTAKYKKKLAASFPADGTRTRTDMDNITDWQVKAADLREKAADVRRSGTGNEKAATTYEKSANEYLARVKRLRAKMKGGK